MATQNACLLDKRTLTELDSKQLFYFFKSMVVLWGKIGVISDELIGTFYFHGFLLFKDKLIYKMDKPQEYDIYRGYMEIFHKFVDTKLSEFNQREVMYLWKSIEVYELKKLEGFGNTSSNIAKQMVLSNQSMILVKKVLGIHEKWDKIFNTTRNIADCEKVLESFLVEVLGEPGLIQHRLIEKLLLWKSIGNTNYFKVLVAIDPKSLDFSKTGTTYEKWVDQFGNKLYKLAHERSSTIAPKVGGLLDGFRVKCAEASMEN